MPAPDAAAARFVRALLRHGTARPGADGGYRVAGAGGARLAAAEVAALARQGVIATAGEACRPGPGARSWLRRAMLGAAADAHAAQHREERVLADGTRLNLAESPLGRLAVAAAGEAAPFLAPHQVEAGERVRRLAERAQLRPRLTMAYDPTRTASSRSAPGDIGDMAADARRALAEIARVLPRDCADVVFDVCGLLKGLQTIESERGWPRRSAKLVLRIGLDQLARHYGLAPLAVGADRRRVGAWMDGARPEMFPGD